MGTQASAQLRRLKVDTQKHDRTWGAGASCGLRPNDITERREDGKVKDFSNPDRGYRKPQKAKKPASGSEFDQAAGYKPCGLRKTDTLEDALKRADSLAGPTHHSGIMTVNKDARRIVLLVYEYRKLKASL